MKVEQSWQGLKIVPERQLQTVGRPWLADSFELLLAGVLGSEKYETEQKNEGDTARVATIVPVLIGPWNLPLPQEILPNEETILSDGDGFFERLQLQNEVAGSAEDAGKERVFRGLNQVKDEALKLVGLEEELRQGLRAKGFTVTEEGNMVPGKGVAVALADAGEGSFHQGRDGTIFIGKELPAELKVVPGSRGMRQEISPEGIRNESRIFERVELPVNELGGNAENAGKVRILQGINRAKDEAINLVGIDEGLRQGLRAKGFTVTEEGNMVPGKGVAVALADAGEGSFHQGRDGTIFTGKELSAELKAVPDSKGMQQEISLEGIRNGSRVLERAELLVNEVAGSAEDAGKERVFRGLNQVKDEALKLVGLEEELSQGLRAKGFTAREESITVPNKGVAGALADVGEGSFHQGRDGVTFIEKELPAELKVVPGSKGMQPEISPEEIRNESRAFERVEPKKNEVTVVAENGGKKNIPQAEQGEVKAELNLSSKGLQPEPSQAIREKEAVKTFSKEAKSGFLCEVNTATHEKPKPAVEIPTFDLSPKVAKNALDNLLPAENLKFNFPSFLAKVENLVQKAQKAGTNLTASFKLYPEELGEVRVTVKLTGKNVEISLKVFSNEAAWYLQNAGKELAVTLQKHHLELSGFNVGLEQNSNFFNQNTFSFTKNNARLQKVKNYQNGPVAEPVLEKNPLAEKVTGLNCLV
ncbi:flagellar hook-length control protein FliK [Carboxydothermus islandicus]|uniref:Flagellar hook-length control protein FliK n=1 Tax=Carboxydothermus islandicus TaxID=661089 RepID=A0A1L8D4R8_9THEO|nr:flagellar hook-length control protein FliK [Carboxydothermus islandicus]GAV26162.1 flagellar hook-length control protein FliK [Carboxydothermus islandicus]